MGRTNCLMFKLCIKSFLQVIAIESAKWSSSEVETPEGMPILPQSKQNRPVVPQSKQNRGLDGLITMLMEGVNRFLASGEEEIDGDAKEELVLGSDSNSTIGEDEDALDLETLGEGDQTEGDEVEEEEGEEEEEGDEEDLEIEEDEDFVEDADGDEGDAEEEGDSEDIEESVDGEVEGEEEADNDEMDEDFRDD